MLLPLKRWGSGSDWSQHYFSLTWRIQEWPVSTWCSCFCECECVCVLWGQRGVKREFVWGGGSDVCVKSMSHAPPTPLPGESLLCVSSGDRTPVTNNYSFIPPSHLKGCLIRTRLPVPPDTCHFLFVTHWVCHNGWVKLHVAIDTIVCIMSHNEVFWLRFETAWPGSEGSSKIWTSVRYNDRFP